VTQVGPGENVKVKLKGIEEEDVSPGFVLCDPTNPTTTGRIFDAQVVILEHKSIICAGYSAVMHIHCVAEEVTVKVFYFYFHMHSLVQLNQDGTSRLLGRAEGGACTNIPIFTQGRLDFSSSCSCCYYVHCHQVVKV